MTQLFEAIGIVDRGRLAAANCGHEESESLGRSTYVASHLWPATYGQPFATLRAYAQPSATLCAYGQPFATLCAYAQPFSALCAYGQPFAPLYATNRLSSRTKPQIVGRTIRRTGPYGNDSWLVSVWRTICGFMPVLPTILALCQYGERIGALCQLLCQWKVKNKCLEPTGRRY